MKHVLLTLCTISLLIASNAFAVDKTLGIRGVKGGIGGHKACKAPGNQCTIIWDAVQQPDSTYLSPTSTWVACDETTEYQLGTDLYKYQVLSDPSWGYATRIYWAKVYSGDVWTAAVYFEPTVTEVYVP